MVNNIRITADGTIEQFVPSDGREFSLEEVQGAVGGHIEIVPLSGKRYMLVDEEGLLKDRPYNTGASALAGKRIVGDVAIIPMHELS